MQSSANGDDPGPVLVSPTAIRDPQALSVKAIYNSATVQDGHVKDMIFNLRQQEPGLGDPGFHS